MSRSILLVFALAACEWNPGIEKVDARVTGDVSTVDMTGPMRQDHLLLTEIAMSPVGGEFIEFNNPTSEAVDLSTYYLSDDGNYWQLPVDPMPPLLSTTDFIVKMPAVSLPPGGFITVAIKTAAAFTSMHGVAPTYSILDGTVTRTYVPDPNMTSLTDSGETVVLFSWDGTADLVTDVDIMVVGAPAAANRLVNKSGVRQRNSTYATDAMTIAPQPAAPLSNFSTKRIADETDNELHDGTGNGVSGDDETSEDTSATWDTTFTAPTPGV